jgi:hypothetical protein
MDVPGSCKHGLPGIFIVRAGSGTISGRTFRSWLNACSPLSRNHKLVPTFIRRPRRIHMRYYHVKICTFWNLVSTSAFHLLPRSAHPTFLWNAGRWNNISQRTKLPAFPGQCLVLFLELVSPGRYALKRLPFLDLNSYHRNLFILCRETRNKTDQLEVDQVPFLCMPTALLSHDLRPVQIIMDLNRRHTG